MRRNKQHLYEYIMQYCFVMIDTKENNLIKMGGIDCLDLQISQEIIIIQK